MANIKEIRKELKSTLGYNARQVSVSSKHYSNIVFTIRNAEVDKKAVQEFADNYEKVDRCPVTYEILSGGNTFVEVRVAEDVLDVWAEKYIEEASVAMAIMNSTDETSITIVEGYSLMRCGQNDVNLIKWGGYLQISSRAIAIKMNQ